MDGIRGAWTVGQHITIDESMIKYMGRPVSYIQYMPAKLIKHGIKVYAVFCDIYVVLLGFKICVGKEDNSENTALNVCNGLRRREGLTGIGVFPAWVSHSST